MTQDMTSPRPLSMPVAANDRSGLAAGLRIKLTKRTLAIKHPNPQAGERLLAEALGAADRDALHGLLTQLMRAGMTARKPCEANLAFMISMVKGIAPKDSIESMLAAQMVSVHAAAMRSACRLALTEDLAEHESITRGLTRLARTFAAQIEALSRHRSNGERAITVQNLSVQDGGRAIVGNVTQHASMIVAEPNAATDAGPVPPNEAGEWTDARQDAVS